MVFNATFNNISVISWLSIILVEISELITSIFSLNKLKNAVKISN